MTCLGQPPTTPEAWFAAVNACATAYGGPDWPSLALTGLGAVVLLLAVGLMVGAIVVRLR